MGIYADISDVEDHLRVQQRRIVIGDDEPQPGINDIDVSTATVDGVLNSVEKRVTARLGRFYNTPLALADPDTVELIRGIVVRLAAYEIWTMIDTTLSTGELPAVVQAWKTNAEADLQMIVPIGQETPLDGRDIILPGETLRGASGDVGGLVFGITRSLPYGADSG